MFVNLANGPPIPEITSEKILFDSFAKINSQKKIDILGNFSEFQKIKKNLPIRNPFIHSFLP